MPYCPDCGVEIGQAKRCPLCGADNPRSADMAGSVEKLMPRPECGEQEDRLAGSDHEDDLTKSEKQKVAWEILSVALAITAATVLVINLLVAKRLSWSLYPLASIMFIWTWATAFLILGRKPRLQTLLIAVAPPVFLVVLGFIIGKDAWAWRLALPICLLAEGVAATISLLARNARRKGLNILAFVFAGCAILCLGIELFIDIFIGNPLRPGWSVVTALALLPIAVFLLYIHHRVATSTNLRRLFKL
ncbi:MAG: DUF6320 domain-containing protein [Spirochaetia bacterium]|nr:DUF6320 domain-containing protein [Spirochaetia bacterium]